MILLCINYIGGKVDSFVVADKNTYLPQTVTKERGIEIGLRDGFKNAVLVNKRYFRARKGEILSRRYIDEGRLENEYGGKVKQKASERSTSDRGRRKSVQRGSEREFEQRRTDRLKEASLVLHGQGCEQDNQRVIGDCPLICGIVTAQFANHKVFRRLFIQERNRMVRGAFVDVKPKADLKDCKCIMLPDAKGFVTISKDGTIGSLMRSPRYDGSNFATNMLAHAINNGGEKLDCYAMDGYGLAHLYSVRGFVPVCKVKFDVNYQPENWRAEWGTPDIVFLFYCGDKVQDFIKNATDLSYPEYDEYSYVPYVDEFPSWRELARIETDYDFGLYIRDVVLELWKTKYKGAFRKKLTSFVKYVIGKHK